MDKELRELRQWRDLGRRRDENVRALLRKGHSAGKIAAASGLSVTRVKEIGKRRFPSASA